MSDPITQLTAAQEQLQEAQAAKENYLKRDAVAVDIFADEIADGPMDETISSRMARWATTGKGIKRFIGRVASKGLNLFQPDHGAKAEAGDLERAQAVATIEETSGNLPPG